MPAASSVLVDGYMTTTDDRQRFLSPTYGELSLDGVLAKMDAYQHEAPKSGYRLYIGTDSLPSNHRGAILVTAIVLHREGNGGIYFWHRKRFEKLPTLRDRMYQEALQSIDTAKMIAAHPQSRTILRGDIEIHVDVGHHGPTREMIKEIVGMVKANGFPVKTKPSAVAASTVADRHTVPFTVV